MRTYATKNHRPAISGNCKPYVVHRVFGPGRTKQIDASATPVEAIGVVDTELKNLQQTTNEPVAFVVICRSKIVYSHGLSEVGISAR